MTSKTYAQALYQIWKEDGKADLAKRFRAYLSSKGKRHLLPSIYLELQKIARADARVRTCEVVYMKESNEKAAIEEGKKFLASVGEDPKGWIIVTRHDQYGIGGYIIRAGNLERDTSDRTLLHRLYDRLRNANADYSPTMPS